MSEIGNELVKIPQKNSYLEQSQNDKSKKPQYRYLSSKEMTIRDEYVTQHKKNGLFERLYNAVKNFTGLGVGSKKAQKAVVKAENNEITESEAQEVINKYRKSQVNGVQAFGDLMSVGAAGLTYFGLRNSLKMDFAVKQLNDKFGSKSIFTEIAEDMPTWKTIGKALRKLLVKIAGSKKKLTVFTTGVAVLAGGFTKWGLLKINRIGSNEYKTNKKDYNGATNPYDKAAYKIEKKMHSSERRGQNFRNFASGAINGLLMPVSVLGGAIIGVPLYLAGNSLNRFFIANKEDKDKTINGYINNLKSDGIAHAALAVSVAVPLIRKGRFSAVFDKNLEKAYKAIEANAVLKENPYGGKTAYEELQEILLKDPAIDDIITNSYRQVEVMEHESLNYVPYSPETITTNDAPTEIAEYIKKTFGEDAEIVAKKYEDYFAIKTPDGNTVWYDISRKIQHFEPRTVEQQVADLTEANIFAVKFKQIESDGGILADILKEHCPPTYTLEEAQKEVSRIYGDKYTLENCMGVGTVAETYLAKDKDGKQVCIKMLKKGINAEKIEADKQKFLDIINNLAGKSEGEKNYLKRQVEDLAKTIGQEVDLKNELEAAKKLVGYTKTARVVKPIEVKDNIYVMEKADGISFKKLLDINSLKCRIKRYEDKIAKAEDEQTKKEYEKRLAKAKKEEAELNTKYKDIVLNEKDFDYIIDEYMDVLVEQLYKVGKEGRTLHGDIHPGNIFIDVKAVKARKGKCFTLIDTGNTIDLNADQAARSMRLTQYLDRGDTKDLAKYFIEDADLSGSSLTKEQAEQKIEEALNQIFFDSETRLKTMTNSEIINITSNIMKDMNIMPGSSQMSLDKARKSAEESFMTLLDMWGNEAFGQIGNEINATNLAIALQKSGKALSKLGEYKELQQAQEKRNILSLIKSPREFFRSRNNPNYKDKNSVEYLTYHLKQGIKEKSEFD